MHITEERERWIKGIVTALWEELAAGRQPRVAQLQPVQQQQGLPPSVYHLPESWRSEIAGSSGALDVVEERVRLIGLY